MHPSSTLTNILRFMVTALVCSWVTSGIAGSHEAFLWLQDNLPEAARDSLQRKWTWADSVTFTVSQVSFTNWSAGGENAVTGDGELNISALLKQKKYTWDNKLRLEYGMISKSGDLRKTNDKIDIVSKYDRMIQKNLYYSIMVNGKTQMTPGYDYQNDSLISNFLAPGYIFTTLGVEYRMDKGFKLLFAPASGKITIVADQNLANRGAFGVIKGTFDEVLQVFKTLGENLRYEFGGFLKISFNGNITPYLSVDSRLDLFSNYATKPQNIDVNWEVKGNIRLSRWFSINMKSHLVYDDDVDTKVDHEGRVLVGPKVQFHELMGVGFTLRF